ncbi:MAG: NUDIX domain-containing protein [Bacilli bacterium]
MERASETFSIFFYRNLFKGILFIKTRNSIKTILLNEKNELLLVYTDDKNIRNETEKYNGGFWQMVGGKIEDGEDYISAIKREIFEETSIVEDKLDIGPIVFKGRMTLNINGEANDIRQSFVVVHHKVASEVNLKNLTEEEKPVLKKLKWFSYDEIKNCDEIIYPVVLSDYLKDIIDKKYPIEVLEIDIAKQPEK